MSKHRGYVVEKEYDAEHHPGCGDYGPGCWCGPCKVCDEGYVERYMGPDAGGYSYMDVPVECPTCNGTMIDPEGGWKEREVSK